MVAAAKLIELKNNRWRDTTSEQSGKERWLSHAPAAPNVPSATTKTTPRVEEEANEPKALQRNPNPTLEVTCLVWSNARAGQAPREDDHPLPLPPHQHRRQQHNHHHHHPPSFNVCNKMPGKTKYHRTNLIV